MSTTSIGFAVSDDDRDRLDSLAAHFAGGNRSAYLRATFKIMESIQRADQLRELQARSHRRLAEQNINEADLDDLIKKAYKGSEA